MSRVLVTGANGFVGLEATAALRQAGFEVRAAVRRPDPAIEALGCDTIVVGNIGSETDWTAALDGVNSVLHLAGRAHITKEASADPLADFRAINVGGTTSLAAQAARCRVRRLVYVSSVKVNGESTNGRAFAEEDLPNPQDAYGVSKREAEEALWRIASATGMEAVVVRPVLVYGPRVRANFLNLLNSVYRGVPLPLAGIENRRSMIALRNLTDLLICALRHPAAAGETFLASDGEDDSTPGWIRRIAAALGRTARLVPVPVSGMRFAARLLGREGAFDRLCGSLQVDSSKAVRRLAWNRPVSVNEELSRTAAWYISTLTHQTKKQAAP